MYVSKFLLNRQKIFNTAEIIDAIGSYFDTENAEPGIDYFYRLEWYKIGVAVPVIVYSKFMPKMKVMKELQLFESEHMPQLSDESELRFSLFAVPDGFVFSDPVEQMPLIEKWLKQKLKGAAKVTYMASGPHNCLFYNINGEEHTQQTVTLNGTLKVTDYSKLSQLRAKPLGLRPELGCGLLLLS